MRYHSKFLRDEAEAAAATPVAASRRPDLGRRRPSRRSRPDGQYGLFDPPAVATHAGGIPIRAGDTSICAAACRETADGGGGGSGWPTGAIANEAAVAPDPPGGTMVAPMDGRAEHGDDQVPVQAVAPTCDVDARHRRDAGVSPAASAAPSAPAGDRVSFVVNDRKPELSQATSRNPEGEIGGMPLLPQGNPMILTTHYINSLDNTGDAQPLRDAVKLMSRFELDPRGLARLGEEGIVTLINRFVDESDSDGVPANMANPERLARRILFALARLWRQFPDAGFPRVMEPEPMSLPPLEDDCKPALLEQQVRGWKPRLRGEPAGAGTGRPMQPTTKIEYRQIFWKVVQLCVLNGIDLNDYVGIELMTARDAIDQWLPLVREHYAKSTVAPVLSAVSRITADLLGPQHPNVLALKAAVGNNFHPHELPVDKIDELRDAVGRNEDETDAITIWELPSAIDERARAPRLRPSDRDSRRSCATALEILLVIPTLTPTALTGINLHADIERKGAWALSYKDDLGNARKDKLNGKARRRILALEEARRRARRPSPWLFRGKGGVKPQGRRTAMNALATAIQMTAGRRFSISEIRDAIVVNAFDGRQADAKTISDGVHLKDPRSAWRRFRIAIERPLEGEQGEGA